MPVSFSVSLTLPVSAQQLYDAWLDGETHGLMTGGEAVSRPEEGSVFTVWDEYITGKHLELIPHSRIVQSWRSQDFSEEDPDSHLAILFQPAPGGCLLTINHSNIPDGQPDYAAGWEEHYFEPMRAFFDPA